MYLPRELWEMIMLNIEDINDLITLSKINKTFADILNENNASFWKQWITYHYEDLDYFNYKFDKCDVELKEAIRLFEQPEICFLCGRVLYGCEKPLYPDEGCMDCSEGTPF